MTSAPGCWAAFGKVLEREYSDYQFARHHQMSVDAYAVQHPGSPSPQTIQSVAVHLVSLYRVLEEQIDTATSTRMLQSLTKHKQAFTWLEPPQQFGELTVVDILEINDPKVYVETVKAWGKSAWDAWSVHHHQIKEWSRLG